MGTERNLLVDGGYRWVDHVPESTWHLSGELKLHSDRCLDTLLRLNSRVVDVSPPARFVNAMSQLMSGSHVAIPWAHVMPEREHRAHVRKLINEASEALETISKDYYVNTWVPQSTVLRSLQPARVSQARYREVLALAGNNAKSIENFCPNDNGFAATVAYDRFGTRTGRLTVDHGPGILTLKRDYRDMLVPSDPKGCIAYIDFAALEARIMLYEAGGRCDEHDMYAFISRELFGGTASRDSIKLAVISELYGVGKHTLGDQLGIAGKELDGFIGKVKRFFRGKELLKRVKGEFIKTGMITNRHGRKIVIDEPLDHILINSYAQSTGVDVSLLGFSDIVRQLQHLPGIRPLFVLHDALILDVPAVDLEAVKAIKQVKVPGYVQNFFLKCETFPCTSL